MIIYCVRTGDSEIEVETSAEASALAVAIMAIDREMPEVLGRIIEVTGGQFTGDNATYLSTGHVCREMGIATRERATTAQEVLQ